MHILTQGKLNEAYKHTDDWHAITAVNISDSMAFLIGYVEQANKETAVLVTKPIYMDITEIMTDKTLPENFRETSRYHEKSVTTVTSVTSESPVSDYLLNLCTTTPDIIAIPTEETRSLFTLIKDGIYIIFE